MTVCAEMLIWHFLAVIVAFNVLPGITLGAIDGVAVIVCVDANTFDGVILDARLGRGERIVSRGCSC